MSRTWNDTRTVRRTHYYRLDQGVAREALKRPDNRLMRRLVASVRHAVSRGDLDAEAPRRILPNWWLVY